MEFIKTLMERGSAPARYAFKDSIILFSRINNLQNILADIVRFLLQEKASRRMRFAAQLLAWKWYYSEAVKKQNLYLINLSVHKLVLFSCRLILNENNMLYPYHKWLLRVVKTAPDKPDNFDEAVEVEQVMTEHSLEYVNQFCRQVLQYVGLEENSLDWPNYFIQDSELNWMEHKAPVVDI